MRGNNGVIVPMKNRRNLCLNDKGERMTTVENKKYIGKRTQGDHIILFYIIMFFAKFEKEFLKLSNTTTMMGDVVLFLRTEFRLLDYARFF